MDVEPRDGGWTFAEGATVYGADGEKVGQVIALYGDFVVVEKGFFFPTDYYIPTSAVASYEGDEITLNVTKDEALHHGWDEIPTVLVDSADQAMVTDPDVVVTDQSLGSERDSHTEPFEHRVEGDVSHRDEDETVTVQVHEEDALATTRERDLGEVRIEKEIVTDEQEIDVPVIEERLRVERRPVDREVTGDEAVLEERTFSVPIRGEVVDVDKDVRVAEEVDVSKEAVERTATVETTVRHEEVHVDNTAAIATGEDSDDVNTETAEAGQAVPPDPDIPEPGMPSDPRNPSEEDDRTP